MCSERRHLLVIIAIIVASACDNSPTEPMRPVATQAAAAGELAFRQVSSSPGAGGGVHSCGVTTDNRVYCWGINLWGELGIGNTAGPDDCGNPCSIRPIAVQTTLRFLQVSTGDRYTCALTTGHRIYCWGRNVEGQLGDGTQDLRVTPVPVATTRKFKAVRAGSSHTCGITETDAAFCWGSNGFGVLGDGTTTPRLTPVAVAGGRRWRDIDAGSSHTCGTTLSNVGYCWGHNGIGKLGDGTTTTRLKPTPVAGNLAFRQVSAGSTTAAGSPPPTARTAGGPPARRRYPGQPLHADPGVRRPGVRPRRGRRRLVVRCDDGGARLLLGCKRRGQSRRWHDARAAQAPTGRGRAHAGASERPAKLRLRGGGRQPRVLLGRQQLRGAGRRDRDRAAGAYAGGGAALRLVISPALRSFR